jgi:hypothetical protein
MHAGIGTGDVFPTCIGCSIPECVGANTKAGDQIAKIGFHSVAEHRSDLDTVRGCTPDTPTLRAADSAALSQVNE